MTAQPNVTLTMEHVPARCRRARTFLLGPLMPEDLDPASFLPRPGPGGRPGHGLALMAQGLQRWLDGSGRVQPLKAASPLLESALGPHTTVYLSDVETDAWAGGAVERLAARTSRLLVTRGGAGADEHFGGVTTRRPPFPVPAVVDTNGAGDCFATAHALAADSLHHRHPAAVANWAGGLAVAAPQACKPACITLAMREQWAAVPRLVDRGAAVVVDGEEVRLTGTRWVVMEARRKLADATSMLQAIFLF